MTETAWHRPEDGRSVWAKFGPDNLIYVQVELIAWEALICVSVQDFHNDKSWYDFYPDDHMMAGALNTENQTPPELVYDWMMENIQPNTVVRSAFAGYDELYTD